MALILIIEDEPAITMALEEGLSDEGYQVEVAANGQAGLERLERLPTPDLVLVDLHLPLVSGLQVVEAMRANETCRDTPVIFITGATIRTETTPPGVTYQAILRKPFGLDEVLNELNKFLVAAETGR